MSASLPLQVDIREVGPRDGLQVEAPLPAADRARLIQALLDAGIRHIEAVSFVSPRAVPAMGGAGDVIAAVQAPRGVRVVALVPNVRGAELARAAGVRELSFTISACPIYNERNVGMTVDESLDQLSGIAAASELDGLDAVVSCAFGSPYAGDIPAGRVARLGDVLRERGATSLTFADTTGVATPPRVEALVAETGSDVGLHLHDTRGTALVNAYAGLECGVARFDTSIGGLGGSPFAPGAAGNLATEDLVYLLDDLGIETGIDFGGLLTASALVARLVGHPVPSRVAAAGPRSGRAEPAEG